MIQQSQSLRRRCAAALALAALMAGSATAAPAASAADAPVRAFSELSFDHRVTTWTDSACRGELGSEVSPKDVLLADNGTATSSASRSETFSPLAAAPDTIGISVSQKATARSAARNGAPALLQVDFSGQARTAPSSTAASCNAGGMVRASLRFTFTIKKSLWVTLSYTKKGTAFAEAYIYGTDGDRPYEDLFGHLFKGSGSTTALLPPGEYSGYVQGQTHLPVTSAAKSLPASGTVKMAFAEPGTAIVAPSGTAKSYVGLGAARSCAAHVLPAKLTSSSKRIRSVSKVTFAVNGKTVKTLRGKQVKRGLAIKLPVRDDVRASVRVTVTPKKGKGKTRTVTASYRPCS